MEARLASKIDASGSCWEWLACKDVHGYGYFSVGSKLKRAHRVVYEALVGPIPPGLTLDHLCRNRSCVNPDHLEPVTLRENTLRGETVTATNAAKAICTNGHPLSEDNLYRYKTRTGSHRGCMKCRAEAQRRYRARKRGGK